MTVAELTRVRLARTIDQAESEWSSRPIRWGAHDCALGAANVLQSVLGYDPAAQFRGRYTTPRGYLRVLRRDGFDTLDEALAAMADRYGWVRIDAIAARVGDVGVAGESVAVNSGGNIAVRQARACVLYKAAGFWIGPRDRGFGVKPTSEIELAFRVI